MAHTLTLKGIREGLLVTVAEEAEWDRVAIPELLGRVEQNQDFFRGARLTLQLGPRALSAAELGRLRDLLSDRGVSLWCVLGESASTAASARALGLETALPAPPPPRVEDEPFPSALDVDQAVLVRKTLRSGNSVRHPGHVVVIGDVNPGAEIIAGGNVVVWGRLRGVVHAGATGDNSAVVCALELNPTQLRIGEHIAISPGDKSRPAPEMARIQDGQVVAERWSIRGGG